MEVFAWKSQKESSAYSYNLQFEMFSYLGMKLRITRYRIGTFIVGVVYFRVS